MGKMSRDKGARVEREIVNCHKEAGIHAERYDAVEVSSVQSGHMTSMSIGKVRTKLRFVARSRQGKPCPNGFGSTWERMTS